MGGQKDSNHNFIFIYLFTKEVCVMHTSLNFVHTINTYLVKCILNIVECKVQSSRGFTYQYTSAMKQRPGCRGFT